MFDRLHMIGTAGLAILWIATAAYAIFQDRALDDMTRARDEAVRARNAAERAIVVMADEHAAELSRKTIAGSGKEAIRALPEGADSGIAPGLRMGLQTADQLGGFE